MKKLMILLAAIAVVALGWYASTYLLVKVRKEKSGWKKIDENQSPNQPELKCP